MKKILAKVAFLLALGCLLLPAHAHGQTTKEPVVKPPSSPSKVLLDAWNDIGRKVIAMAEDFPEDKYDFKPNPTERSFAEQLLHAAGGNYFFIDPVLGKKVPERDPNRNEYKSKSDLVAYVKKSFADGEAVLKEKGDKGMGDLLVDPFNHQQVRVSDVAWGLIEHSGEHYGQLVVYYRVAGLVPPESRPKK